LPSRSFTRPQEDSYGCTALRTLQSAPAAEWTGTPARALWAVWDHPAEQDRTIESLMATARAYRWNRFIRPGSVAIDIGGHAGDTALPMALLAYDRIAGTRGTVIVLEPNPAVLPVLRANLAMNTHLASFHLIEAAAADHDADSIELADHNNAGCNGGVLNGGFSAPVSAILNAAATIRYTAPAVSMAALLRHVRTSITAQPVGFIKFACQGFDKQILKPCRELFQVDQPVLFVNWFGWFTAEDDADLFATIEAIGYVPFDPVTLAPASVTQRIGNLLCVHRGRLSLLDASH
jgi:FkbM family methyltransferase